MNSLLRIGYICGAYSAPTKKARQANIDKARAVAEKFWAAGLAVYCPHLNTAHMDKVAPPEVFYEGDLAILAFCSYVVLVPGNWQESEGVKAELMLAAQMGKEIYDDVDFGLDMESLMALVVLEDEEEN